MIKPWSQFPPVSTFISNLAWLGPHTSSVFLTEDSIAHNELKKILSISLLSSQSGGRNHFPRALVNDVETFEGHTVDFYLSYLVLPAISQPIIPRESIISTGKLWAAVNYTCSIICIWTNKSVMRFSADWWSHFIHQPALGHVSWFHSARSLSLTTGLGAKPLEVWLIVNQRAIKPRAVNGKRLGEMIYQTSPCWTLLPGRSGSLG